MQGPAVQVGGVFGLCTFGKNGVEEVEHLRRAQSSVRGEGEGHPTLLSSSILDYMDVDERDNARPLTVPKENNATGGVPWICTSLVDRSEALLLKSVQDGDRADGLERFVVLLSGEELVTFVECHELLVHITTFVRCMRRAVREKPHHILFGVVVRGSSTGADVQADDASVRVHALDALSDIRCVLAQLDEGPYSYMLPHIVLCVPGRMLNGQPKVIRYASSRYAENRSHYLEVADSSSSDTRTLLAPRGRTLHTLFVRHPAPLTEFLRNLLVAETAHALHENRRTRRRDGGLRRRRGETGEAGGGHAYNVIHIYECQPQVDKICDRLQRMAIGVRGTHQRRKQRLA